MALAKREALRKRGIIVYMLLEEGTIYIRTYLTDSIDSFEILFYCFY